MQNYRTEEKQTPSVQHPLPGSESNFRKSKKASPQPRVNLEKWEYKMSSTQRPAEAQHIMTQESIGGCQQLLFVPDMWKKAKGTLKRAQRRNFGYFWKDSTFPIHCCTLRGTECPWPTRSVDFYCFSPLRKEDLHPRACYPYPKALLPHAACGCPGSSLSSAALHINLWLL